MDGILWLIVAFTVAVGLFAIHTAVKSRHEEPLIDLDDIESLRTIAEEDPADI